MHEIPIQYDSRSAVQFMIGGKPIFTVIQENLLFEDFFFVL